MLRTPDDRFANLPDYPFTPHYLQLGEVRVHYVAEGPVDGPVFLLLHGEPSWSFLYRHMIPPLAAAGFRTIAPDLPGFGKSDKLADRAGYSFQQFVDWMWGFVETLDLHDITLFGQDWGSLIGLRLVGEHPERFARVAIGNGGLPTGDQAMPEAFQQWQSFVQNVSRLPIGRIMQGATTTTLSKEVLAGYEAPFPDESYKEAARIMPALVPTTADNPASAANRTAWRGLMRYDKPFLTTFSDGDPITAGGERVLQRLIPGAKGQPHTTIQGAGHFLQEDKGPELAQILIQWAAIN
ncbi:MAG: haloalkane dehalogenase [Chloroflexi bacterium]|nr:haloalkane dehalogenase [Chloroflexota bacterium]